MYESNSHKRQAHTIVRHDIYNNYYVSKSVNNCERKKIHNLRLADMCDPIVVPISEVVCKSKMHC